MMTFRHLGQLGFLLDFGGTKVGVDLFVSPMKGRLVPPQAKAADLLDVAFFIGTHDHADHIRAVGTLGEKIHLPIYATQLIHQGIDRNYGVSLKLRTARKYFEKGVPFELCGMTINTFDVSHDSTE